MLDGLVGKTRSRPNALSLSWSPRGSMFNEGSFSCCVFPGVRARHRGDGTDCSSGVRSTTQRERERHDTTRNDTTRQSVSRVWVSRNFPQSFPQPSKKATLCGHFAPGAFAPGIGSLVGQQHGFRSSALSALVDPHGARERERRVCDDRNWRRRRLRSTTTIPRS